MTVGDADKKSLTRVANEWRERISSVDATEADREALDSWLAQDIRHEEAFDRAQTYWAAYDHLRREDIDPDLMPRAQRNPLAQIIDQSKALVSQPLMRLAAAAAVISIVATPIALDLGPAEPVPLVKPAPISASYQTGVAETLVVTLDDGTIATLGALTHIESSISDRARFIVLKSGAALFNVVHDPMRPLSVEAGDLTATAVGTEFEVRSNGGVYRVAVSEGSVEVAFPYTVGGTQTSMVTRTILDHGQEVAANPINGLGRIRMVDVHDIGAWRENRLVYEGATLNELVADANRYSETDIVLVKSARSFADSTITASFDATNIDRMLAMLALSFPIEVDDSEFGVIRLTAKDSSAE